MKFYFKWVSCLLLLAPVFASSQVVPPVRDTSVKAAPTDTLPMKDSAAMVKKDTVYVDSTAVKKTCYAEWFDAFRTRGAKAVPDGMQQVVISLKDAENCRCFMGQVEVVGGKIKPPLYFQQENGDYRPVSIVGKKLEAAFTTSMTPEELYAIKDGMSILFRTSDQEYGRLFFYKYVNKLAQSNKEALSPAELIKD